MKDGYMNVIAYSYLNQLERTVIGYPYVEDRDDWDVGRKTFKWVKSTKGFSLDNGKITMEGDMPAGIYDLQIDVYDSELDQTARSYVKVTVIPVPEIAIKNHVNFFL